MIALWGLLALSNAQADTLRATLRIDDDGVHVVHAVRLQGNEGVVPGDLEVLDAQGHVLGTASLPPLASFRSVITPDGHETARIESRYVRVALPWSDAAETLRLDDLHTTKVPIDLIRPPPAGSVAEAVMQSGPSTNRLDLVILPEGYIAADEALFDTHVDTLVDHMLQLEPYTVYGDLVNIWKVFLPSPERGVDQPDQRPPIDVDTLFDCAYNCDLVGTATGRLVCCDEATILDTVNAQVPFADGALVLLNSDRYGGSGGQIYATAYTGDADALRVAAHELGHTLIGLWDEYPYGVNQPTDQAYISPNCAEQNAPVPWAPWLEDGPIDWVAWQTVQRAKQDAPLANANIFCDGRDGANQANFVCAYPACSFNDWVRPTFNGCMMNQLQDGYCPVCREAIVKAVYQGLGGAMIGSADPPADEPLRLEEGDEVLFTVDAVGPQDGLSWTWRHGDTVLATGPDFTLSADDKVCGELTLTVQDTTPWVRVDPDGVLSDTLVWDVRTAPCCGCAQSSGPGLAWLLALPLLALRRRRRT